MILVSIKTFTWSKIIVKKHLFLQLVKEFLVFYQPDTQLPTSITASNALEERLSIPDKIGISRSIHRSGAQLSSYPVGTGVLTPGIKRQGREANHSPPTIMRVAKLRRK
jgi:hypothetical protein